MALNDNVAYQQIKERMKRIDMRSPYYALAAADLRLLDELLSETEAAKNLVAQALSEKVLALELEQAKNAVLEAANSQKAARIVELEAENDQLKAQLLSTITDPPVTEEVVTPLTPPTGDEVIDAS